MASTANISITASDSASGSIKSVQGLLSGLSTQAKTSILTGVGLASGVAAFDLLKRTVGAVADAVKGMIDDASALEQATGAIESVFGSAAGQIKAFGETAAQSFGLSKTEVAQLAAVVGAQLQSMGFSASDAAKQTIELQQRAADLAATFGGTTSDAVRAISALLRGERDPIEQYGISIKQADVSARVFAMGLDTSTTEAKKQSEAIASLALLLEQSASAAGQFGRESESSAGQTARLAAEAENLSAELGDNFLPIWVEVQKVIASAFEPRSGAWWLRDEILETERVTAASGRTTANNWIAMGEAMQAVNEETGDSVRDELVANIKSAVPEIRAAALATVVAYADGLLANQDAISLAWRQMVEGIEREMTTAERIAFLHGLRQSEQLQAGLNSGKPGTVAVSKAIVASIDAELRQLGVISTAAGTVSVGNLVATLRQGVKPAGQAGTDTGAAYNNGIAAAPKTGGTILKNAALAQLNSGGFWSLGNQAGSKYAQGLAAAKDQAKAAGTIVKNAAASAMNFSGSPPFTLAKKIGRQVGESWAAGLSSSLQRITPPVAALPGGISGGATPAMAGAGSAGGVIHTHVYLNGREIAEAVSRQNYYAAPKTALLPKG